MPKEPKKRFEIHVKYTKGAAHLKEYHYTTWGSVKVERAITNSHKIMDIMDIEGVYMFAGVKVIEEDKVIYKLER